MGARPLNVNEFPSLLVPIEVWLAISTSTLISKFLRIPYLINVVGSRKFLACAPVELSYSALNPDSIWNLHTGTTDGGLVYPGLSGEIGSSPCENEKRVMLISKKNTIMDLFIYLPRVPMDLFRPGTANKASANIGGKGAGKIGGSCLLARD